MISEANVTNVQVMRRAARNGDLGLLATTEVESGKTVAVVVAKFEEDGEVEVTPFGYLDVDGATANGKLTKTALKALEQLKENLMDENQQAWLVSAPTGRVHVGFAATEVPPQKDCRLVLNWGNPYELFAAPVTH